MLRDRFLSGPLADPNIASPEARELYVRLSKQQAGSEEETSRPIEELPSRFYLRRQDQLPGIFDYQEDLAERMASLCRESPRRNIGLLALPTGAGKTRTALFAILKLLSSDRVRRVLWIAPGRELLDQAFESMRFLWAGFQAAPNIELVRSHAAGGFPPVGSHAVYFCTPQMLASRMKDARSRPVDIDVVVFDEAHQAVAPAYQAAFLGVRGQGGDAIPAIGLSATPGRSLDESTESLVRLFHGNLIVSPLLRPNAIRSLEERGVLARLEFETIELGRELVGQRRNVTSSMHMGKPVRHFETDSVRFRAVVETACRLAAEQERVLIFAGSVAHANALAAVLAARGCRSAAVSHRTPPEIRDRILREFKVGEKSVLVNRSILATGYDCPAVSAVILSMPVGSSVLFEQIVGRASRGPATGGGPLARIYQIDDHLALHGIPRSYHRYEDFDWTATG